MNKRFRRSMEIFKPAIASILRATYGALKGTPWLKGMRTSMETTHYPGNLVESVTIPRLTTG